MQGKTQQVGPDAQVPDSPPLAGEQPETLGQKVLGGGPVSTVPKPIPAPNPYAPLQEVVGQLPKPVGPQPQVGTPAEQKVWDEHLNKGGLPEDSAFRKNMVSALDTLVQHVPELLSYPDLALAIAGNALTLHDPIGTAQGTMTLQRLHEMETWARDNGEAEKQSIAPVQPGIMGDIGQVPGDIGGFVSDIRQSVTAPNIGASQAALTAPLGRAAGDTVQAIENIPGVGNILHDYIGLQMGELHATAKALYDIGPGISETVGRAAEGPAGVLGAATGNPQWGQDVMRNVKNAVNSGFDFLQKQYRMLSLIQHEHGDAAMVQAALPFIVTAGSVAALQMIPGDDLAGDATLAPEVAASLGAEEAAAATGESVGAAMTAEDAAAAARAIGEQTRSYWQMWSDAAAAAKGDPQAIARILPNAGKFLEKLVQYNPAGLALRGASVAGKFATSPAYMAGTAAQLTADKTVYKNEWHTAGDIPAWEKATGGRPDTIGSFLTQFMPDGELKNTLTDVANFGTYFLIPDPIGAAGYTYSRAYSAEGMPGWLHKYMPGTSLLMADRAYKFLPRVRNAIQYIATHDAGQIIAFNKNLTSIAKDLDGLKIYNLDHSLDREATITNVLEYFAAAETAKKLTTMDALPLRGFGSWLHDAVRDVPLLRQFEKLPFFIDEQGKIESHQFMPEHPQAPFIASRMARQAFHLSQKETDALANLLAHAEPGQFRNVLANSLKAQTQVEVWNELPRLVRKGMKPADALELAPTLQNLMNEKINAWVGTYGVDSKGEFGLAIDGNPISRGLKLDTTGKGDPRSFAMGLYPEHFEAVTIQKFYETRKAVRQIANDYMKMVRNTTKLGNLRYLATDRNLQALSVDYVRDGINEAINNHWFKPLALASPAWAGRVSMNEDALSIFRQGGFKSVATFWADGAAKGDMKMLDYINKVARGTATKTERTEVMDDTMAFIGGWFRKNRMAMPPPREVTMLGFALATLRVSFDRGMVLALGQRELLDAATAALYYYDGHFGPYGILSNHGGDYAEMGYSKSPQDQLAKAATEFHPDLSSGYDVKQVAFTGRFRRYHNTDTEGKFAGMRHFRAKFLQRTEWGPQLMDTYEKAFIDTGSLEEAFAATKAMARHLIDKFPGKKDAYRARNDVVMLDGHAKYEWSGNGLDDWAQAVAHDIQGFIVGPPLHEQELHQLNLIGRSEDSPPNIATDLEGKRRYVDLRSARLIRDKEVPESPMEWMRQVHGTRPDTVFNDVIGPVVDNWRNGEGHLARGTNWLHKNILGHLVNGLSRNHTFVIDFAKERKILAPYVDRGAMTQEQADVLASQRAANRTLNYIHNPYDKTMWDEHLRVIAPFFFAQMQAFRRAGRLLVENPGAFEQYVKLLLGINKGIQAHSKNGAAFYTLPFGMWGVPFQLSLNSMASINPIPNAEDGPFQGNSLLQNFLNAITPRLGPIATAPMIGAEWAALDTGHAGFAAKYARNILGPIAASEPLLVQLFSAGLPNSALQHVIEGATAFFGQDWHFALNQSVVSAQETVMENEVTNLLQSAWVKSAKMTPQEMMAVLETSATSPAYASNQYWQMDRNQQRLTYMYVSVLKHLEDGNNLSNLVSDARGKTMGLWGARTFASWLSPFSVSTAVPFQGVYNRYEALLKQYPNNFIHAETVFLNEFPWALAIAESRSAPTAGHITFPETVPALQWADANKWMVSNYPMAAAALVPTSARDAPYSQFASNALVQLGLRQKDTPQEFMQAFELNLGNQFLYNVAYPAYDKLQSKASGGFNYNTWQMFFKDTGQLGLIPYFGQNVVPQWWSQHSADATAAHRHETANQFIQLALLPQFQGNSVQDEAIYVAAKLAQTVPNIKGLEHTDGYNTIVNRWNGLLDQYKQGQFPADWQITDPKAVGQALAYAIDTIFRPFAAKYNSEGQPIGG